MFTPKNIRTTYLPNGLAILTERMEHTRCVSMGVWLKTGARHDAPELNGLSHFVEHMVFNGTISRSARRIALDSDELGGFINAFTGYETVAFSVTVLDTHVAPGLDLLADILLNPEFDSSAIERERAVVIEEINENKDDPGRLCQDAFVRTLWKDHPLSLPIGGTPETLSFFTRDALVHFAQEHFTGHNMVFAAAGNIEHDDMVSMVEKCFGHAPAGTSLPGATCPAPFAGRTLVDKPTEQVQLVIGVPAPQLTDAQYFTALTAATLLGGGSSSRLFQSVREERGLAYTIAAEYMAFQDTGYFSVYSGTSRAQVEPVLNLILQELHRLKTEPVSPGDLGRVKGTLISSSILGLETSSARVAAMAGQFLTLSRTVGMEEKQALIESVTEDQVMLLANERFDSDRLAVALVGDVHGLELVSNSLSC